MLGAFFLPQTRCRMCSSRFCLGVRPPQPAMLYCRMGFSGSPGTTSVGSGALPSKRDGSSSPASSSSSPATFSFAGSEGVLASAPLAPPRPLPLDPLPPPPPRPEPFCWLWIRVMRSLSSVPYFSASKSFNSTWNFANLVVASLCFCWSALMFCLKAPVLFLSFKFLQILDKSSTSFATLMYRAVGSAFRSRSSFSSAFKSWSSLSEPEFSAYCCNHRLLKSSAKSSGAAALSAATAAETSASLPLSSASSLPSGPCTSASPSSASSTSPSATLSGAAALSAASAAEASASLPLSSASSPPSSPCSSASPSTASATLPLPSCLPF
mmetsp:Transcript_67792/g.220705  ORF Transcript_67792/g.220705 Transcript_67792/m.220705 type:complete len:325 (-) Transcript_67792:963-1937(-)